MAKSRLVFGNEEADVVASDSYARGAPEVTVYARQIMSSRVAFARELLREMVRAGTSELPRQVDGLARLVEVAVELSDRYHRVVESRGWVSPLPGYREIKVLLNLPEDDQGGPS